MAERLVNALLFFVGWVSGGGLLTMIAMFLLECSGLVPKNYWFVAGCMWGTFGVLMGRFMVKHVPQKESCHDR